MSGMIGHTSGLENDTIRRLNINWTAGKKYGIDCIKLAKWQKVFDNKFFKVLNIFTANVWFGCIVKPKIRKYSAKVAAEDQKTHDESMNEKRLIHVDVEPIKKEGNLESQAEHLRLHFQHLKEEALRHFGKDVFDQLNEEVFGEMEASLNEAKKGGSNARALLSEFTKNSRDFQNRISKITDKADMTESGKFERGARKEFFDECFSLACFLCS